MQSAVELPILDISEKLDSSCLVSLASACKTWGFFLITNHGIPKHLYNRLHLLSHQLFSLPSDAKLQLGPKTYTPHFIASPFFESLRVSGPKFRESARGASAQLLLQKQQSSEEEFSEVVQEYGERMTELSKKITKILVMILDDNGFDDHESEFRNCHGYMRINNYSPPEDGGMELGLGKHTDMSFVTIVHQDDIGGLQVRSREGEWMDIRPCEGTLVVNIGDMLQAWSNDKFRSSEHRVVLKRRVNRFSVAFFWCFEDDKVVLAPQEIVGDQNTRLYKPFVCLDYLTFRESNEKGRFEKVGYTVKDFAGI